MRVAAGQVFLCLLVYSLFSSINGICANNKSQRELELEKKLSLTKSTLKLVRGRLEKAKHDQKEWQELLTSKDVVRGQRSDSTSKRDVSQSGCTNLRDRVRLVNGTSSHGRLEIMLDTEWSSVRRAGLGKPQAGIVCASLGYSSEHAHLLTHDVYGDGGDNLLMDHYCQQAVGVMCDGNLTAQQIRLANSSGLHRGRVEIEIAGQWGTICATNFNKEAADLVCQTMGFEYPQGGLAVGRGYFGEGAGRTWLGSVSCTGRETNLLDCSQGGIIPASCSHAYDAGVICDGWMNYPVRLVNGSHPEEGRVEIEILGQWGTIYRYGFDSTAASIVCKMLGYATSGATVITDVRQFGRGTGPVWLYLSSCTGHEEHILQCAMSYPLSYPTDHSSDVGVRCVDGHGSVIG